MTYDLVIRNGRLVDCTGAAPTTGDIAIVGDTIAAMGKVEGTGRREIDAGGCAITPGFIDLHTHLDAQVGWDPLLAPLTYHGVTTALIGNCGVTFAPCRPTDRALLAEMMESVEDIPRATILGGLPWDWETYGEYLDSIDRMNPAINLAGLVGHSAVRFYVMGQRAIDDQPTPAEIDQIASIVGSSIAEGAFGVSVNRLHGHAMPDGRDIPDRMESRQITTASGKVLSGFALPFHPEVSGQFKVVVNATVLGKVYTSEPFTFFVKPFSPETLPQPAKLSTLAKIAQSSGGQFYESTKELDEALSALKMKATEEQISDYRTIWRTWPVLIIVMMLITASWIARKLQNMP
jgi:hypothetical protein